jgi:hypothetical protein
MVERRQDEEIERQREHTNKADDDEQQGDVS